MILTEEIKEKLMLLLEGQWNDIGYCGSCSWHDGFDESYDDIESELIVGLDIPEVIELPCYNDKSSDEDVSGHKGEELYPLELAKNHKLIMEK